MHYFGDIDPGKILYIHWPTSGLSGQSILPGTAGTIEVYKDDGTTQSTAGITDTRTFDSVTGRHMIKLDTSADGTFYAAGHEFSVVLTGAVIDGQTVNTVLAHFSIQNRSALRPTTAGRTLDVSSTGEAGIDLANVGSPTTTLNLSGVTIAEVTAAATREGTIAGYIDTEVAAIKAKTDLIPAAPAAVGDCLTAAGVRTAVGLASANLDTQLGALPTGDENAAALLDLPDGVEDNLTVRELMRGQAAVDLAKASGLNSGAPVFRDTNDTKNRISSTIVSGARTTTLDLT